jgi:hypothetical protein
MYFEDWRSLVADQGRLLSWPARVQLLRSIVSATGFLMTSMNMLQSSGDQPVATFVKSCFLQADSWIGYCSPSGTINEGSYYSTRRSVSHTRSQMTFWLFCTTVKDTQSMLLVDKLHPCRARGRSSRRTWRDIDRLCKELCSSLTKMRRDLGLGGDCEARYSARGLPNKDAREFCARAMSFLGRINGIAITSMS